MRFQESKLVNISNSVRNILDAVYVLHGKRNFVKNTACRLSQYHCIQVYTVGSKECSPLKTDLFVSSLEKNGIRQRRNTHYYYCDQEQDSDFQLSRGHKS